MCAEEKVASFLRYSFFHFIGRTNNFLLALSIINHCIGLNYVQTQRKAKTRLLLEIESGEYIPLKITTSNTRSEQTDLKYSPMETCIDVTEMSV